MASFWGTGIGQPSVLSSGKWYKVSVKSDGVYLLDYGAMSAMGFNPNSLDPKKVQVHAGDNGMLPQSNLAARQSDLRQVALLAVGMEDGRFNQGDYFLFFAQGPDRYGINASTGLGFYENHLYSDKNFYFVTVGATNGLRLASRPTLAGNYPLITEWDNLDYYETEQTNELHSGRTWYGERFDATLEYTVQFNFPNILPGSQIKLFTSMMGRSTGASSFQVLFNGTQVSTQPVPPVTNDPYAIIGSDVRDTLMLNADAVQAPLRTGQDVTIRFTKAASGFSVGYLDYLMMQVKQRFEYPGDQWLFTSLKSLEQPISQYQFSTIASARTWDVSDPFEPIIQEGTFAVSNGDMGILSFATESTSLRKFIHFTQSAGSPKLEGAVPNQNLKGIATTDLLIISAPEFLPEAERLANHRRSQSGLSVTVVSTSEVYHEFSGGKQDVTALRDLIKFLYDKGTGIKNVLLFGRGSFDYKNKLSFNRNFVPIYQSRNSLNPLQTYASDDFYGFLEDSEGNWGEDPPEQHTLDIGVGRIPVTKLDEATAWVDKVIAYENQNWGAWRKRIVFTADDGDFNTHQNQADQLANTLEIDHPEVDVQKLFLDQFPQLQSSNGQVSPDARKALNTVVNSGVGILNFTGHGSELQWMQERILDQVSFDEWKPRNRYPFLVTATCEFGRNDDPGLISSAEISLFQKKSGSIGMVTTSRPVYSSTNFTLNKAFYQSLFTRSNGLLQDWGGIFKLTKNASMSGVQNRNFSLLADPSMYPPFGSAEVVVDNITNLTSGSDTLKALSRVRVQGSIHQQGAVVSDYEGNVQLTLYNKSTPHVTLGDENAPYNYAQRDDAVYRGNASIYNGQFELEFIVPQAIDPTVGMGKAGLYASPRSSQRDGIGAEVNVKIGSAELNTGSDNSGPDIELFMGDTTFISGGLISSSSRIVAILTDQSGIDISNFNPQNDIQASLDDGPPMNLNPYYQADADTYQRGKLDYPMEGLPAGHHTLTLRATDTYGNSSSATISFNVTDQPGIQIEQWLNYPNPFYSSTTFHFKHSHPGEDLEAAVTIFDRMGKVVLYNTYQIGGSTYTVDLPAWDGTTADGNKLPGGLYLMKLSVRSLLDGTKNERIAKVILLN